MVSSVVGLDESDAHTPATSRSEERQESSARRHLPLVQQYLDEQQQLTAVEKFSQLHESSELPAQEKYYRTLLPSSRPAAGQQYGFSVDLDRCTGCKACVTACHNLNGLDADETWRSVGLLHGGTREDPLQQTVTTACHHCIDPACMNGCPVNAYEKDEQTGIVRHLDDQCIGCSYCTLTCPYEVPQFNKRLGIVRKCDMCSDRLAEGEAPACVQACPNEAIAIRIVDKKQVEEDVQGDTFLPAAPSPGITLPTTEYKTKRVFPKNTLPADFYNVRAATNHLPLVFLLVLNQLSVGAFAVGYTVTSLMGDGSVQRYHSLIALAMGLLALTVSMAHLGRPQYAFRAVMGVRHSWMSREAAAFGAFSAAAVAYAGLSWVSPVLEWLSLPTLGADQLVSVQRALGAGVVAFGVLGIVCSVMLYTVTRRAWWKVSYSGPRFLLSTAVQGLSLTILVSATASHLGVRVDNQTLYELSQCLLVMAAFKLLFEASVFTHLRAKQVSDLKRTALLMWGELSGTTQLRFGLGIAGGLLLPAIFAQSVGSNAAAGTLELAPVVVAGLAFACTLIAELLERSLFFMAAAAPKMPGAVGS